MNAFKLNEKAIEAQIEAIMADSSKNVSWGQRKIANLRKKLVEGNQIFTVCFFDENDEKRERNTFVSSVHQLPHAVDYPEGTISCKAFTAVRDPKTGRSEQYYWGYATK